MRNWRESNIVGALFAFCLLFGAWRIGYNAGHDATPDVPERSNDCSLFEDGSMRCDTRDFGVFSGCVVGEWGCQDGGTSLGLAPTEDMPPGLTPEEMNAYQAAMTECMADKVPTAAEPLSQLQSGCADAVAEGPLGDR